VVSAAPVAPPPAPTGLNAAPSNREVALSWAAAPRAKSYLVKRADRPGGPYAEIATAVGATHQDTGLTNDRKYYYVITAVNAGGESAASAEVQASPVDPPTVPENAAATAANTQVLLTWTSVSNATYYQIKRATDRRGPYVTVANVSRIGHVDNNVENGKTYHYIIHALNPGGRSPHSLRVAATP